MRDLECKIKPFFQIRETIGKRPRSRRRKIVLCHGIFDLVHPAHVRHLAYAKAAGAILVVGVLTDRYIPVRSMDPWPDDATRAFCLACHEMVDYVFINMRPTPLYVIGALQPDVYAKGFGPVADPVAEIEAVRFYGGKVI